MSSVALPARVLSVVSLVSVLLVACAPAAPPPPTAPPAQPAPTSQPPARVEQPAPTPAEKPSPQAADRPLARPAEQPTQPPVAKPAAKAKVDEQAVAGFYQGKTVRIITGSAAGGTYDTYSRMLARHMPRYLPGSPTIIVENKPGAGGMLAANSLYHTEPKDGTVIGTFGETLVLREVLGAEGVQYESARFNWLGSAVSTAIACIARTDSGVASMQDVLAGKPLVLGALAPGSTIYDTPAVINAALGTTMQLVPGYDGVARIVLAIEANEVQGMCASFLSLLSTHRRVLEGDNPLARIFLIMGDRTPDHPWLQGVPAAETLAKTDEARQLLQTIHAPSQITNPYAVAPEVPLGRIEALRRAFIETFRDDQFLAEARQVNIEFTPSTGEQVAEVVRRTLNLPPAVVSRLKEILM